MEVCLLIRCKTLWFRDPVQLLHLLPALPEVSGANGLSAAGEWLTTIRICLRLRLKVASGASGGCGHLSAVASSGANGQAEMSNYLSGALQLPDNDEG